MQGTQNNHEKEKESLHGHTSYFQTYCEATLIKAVHSWHKDTHKDRWNRMKIPKINHIIYGH